MFSNKSKIFNNKQVNTKELVYGINTIEVLIKASPHKILTIFIEKKNKKMLQHTESYNLKINRIINLADKLGIFVQEVNAGVIGRWLHEFSIGNNKINHQRIAAHVTANKFLVEEDLIILAKKCENDDKKNPLFLALDNIQDPHNLGACIRSAAAFGVSAIIISRNATCGVTALVKKTACGAADVIPIARIGNLANCLKRLQKEGVWVISLAASNATDLQDIDLKIPLVLVLGSEDLGVRNIIKQGSDFLAKIPMSNHILDSLNLSVATGICLYEVQRQRTYLN